VAPEEFGCETVSPWPAYQVGPWSPRSLT
jgi:hypothetical protein